MTTVPDMREYQQLDEPKTGWCDCSAYSAAILLHAHTKGRVTTTGRRVRLNTDEPVPDPDSPGLTLPQVDDSIRRITGGTVDFDTRIGYRSLDRTQIRNRVVDGRWAGIQVWRGVLVDRGFVSGFRGAHASTIHTLPGEPDVPIVGDPLVTHYIRAGWDALFDAAERLTGGYIYTTWTRDLTPDYHAVVWPDKGYDRRGFARFIVRDGKIVDSRPDTTGGFDVDCTAPAYFANAAGGKGRMLVRLTEGKREGWYIDDKWAREKQP